MCWSITAPSAGRCAHAYNHIFWCNKWLTYQVWFTSVQKILRYTKSNMPQNSRKIYNTSAPWNLMCTKILQNLSCLISILFSEFGLFPCKRPRDIKYFKYRKIQGNCGIAAPPVGRCPPISNQLQFLSRCNWI